MSSPISNSRPGHVEVVLTDVVHRRKTGEWPDGKVPRWATEYAAQIGTKAGTAKFDDALERWYVGQLEAALKPFAEAGAAVNPRTDAAGTAAAVQDEAGRKHVVTYGHLRHAARLLGEGLRKLQDRAEIMNRSALVDGGVLSPGEHGLPVVLDVSGEACGDDGGIAVLVTQRQKVLKLTPCGISFRLGLGCVLDVGCDHGSLKAGHGRVVILKRLKGLPMGLIRLVVVMGDGLRGAGSDCGSAHVYISLPWATDNTRSASATLIHAVSETTSIASAIILVLPAAMPASSLLTASGWPTNEVTRQVGSPGFGRKGE